CKRADEGEEEEERFVDVPEAREVRDALRGLQNKGESLRGRCVPPGDRLLAGHAIEGGIDLDRAQLLRVVLEPLGTRELGRVEASLPFREVVTGRSDV